MGPEKNITSSETGIESIAKLVVLQPPKLESLLMVLADLERISERVSEDRSGDLGSGGQSGTAGATSDEDSLRARAIRSLPSTTVMRKRLTHHLEKEVKQLERRAKKLARSTRKGSAYLLNELYARIRKIQSLILELSEAASDLIRRLYIRFFIDHQQLV
jgi:hypothetical protein